MTDFSGSLSFGTGEWAAQPRQLLATLFGTYAPRDTGWLAISALVDLMGDLGVDQQSVRSAVYRLKRQGVLNAKRINGAAGYTYQGISTATLHDGDARIYGRLRAGLDDGWLLVVFSFPEDERSKRTKLRANLVQRGFGTVSPGVWIAPSHLFNETHTMLSAMGFDDYVETFQGIYLEPEQLRDKAARWWDFNELAAIYQGFIDRHSATADNIGGKNWTPPDRDAFAYYVRLLTDWRRFPYADPGLPLEVVGEDWVGLAAEDLFHRLRADLEPIALRHARIAIGDTVRTSSGHRKIAASAR